MGCGITLAKREDIPSQQPQRLQAVLDRRPYSSLWLVLRKRSESADGLELACGGYLLVWGEVTVDDIVVVWVVKG